MFVNTVVYGVNPRGRSVDIHERRSAEMSNGSLQLAVNFLPHLGMEGCGATAMATATDSPYVTIPKPQLR
jgi:hypothetical protein